MSTTLTTHLTLQSLPAPAVPTTFRSIDLFTLNYVYCFVCLSFLCKSYGRRLMVRLLMMPSM